jgi:protease-4
VRKGGKKVVASMGTVAASGGLYIAVACDTIVANPGTLTGSIGVIFQYPTFERLLDKVG